jgi:hypothetical protein
MAKKSGRRSAADLIAAQIHAGLEPMRPLTGLEQIYWDRVLSSVDRRHFIGLDAILLAQFVEACAVYSRAADAKEMESLGRLILAYATKLRLTPQTRYDNRQAARTPTDEMAIVSSTQLLSGTGSWVAAPQGDKKPN